MNEVLKKSAAEQSRALKNKEISAVELTNAAFERIEELDEKLGAFNSLTKETALETAKKVDEKIAKGEELPLLAGIPLALKDNMNLKGSQTTASSKILENFVSPFNATVTEKLLNNLVPIVGKANLDEFAMGSSNENSAFKKVHNPWDLKKVPGGSSGGSAASVSSCEATLALGSDTGGSIRLPASFCGIVGMKPTYGRVSRYGLIAFASSLDQIGPFARTVEDAANLLEVISGHDPKDSTSLNLESGTSVEKGIPCNETKTSKAYYIIYGVEPEDYADVDIQSLNFSVRLINRLIEENYHTVAELLKSNDDIMEKIRGFGKGCFDELHTYLGTLDSEKQKVRTDSLPNELFQFKEKIIKGDFSFTSELELSDASWKYINRYKEAHAVLDSGFVEELVNGTPAALQIYVMLAEFIKRDEEKKKVQNILHS